MIAPRNGTTKIRMIHPAFAAPERSRRRKMSEKTVMKIQIAMNQKKKTIMAQMTLPSDHSVDSIRTLLPVRASRERPAPERRRAPRERASSFSGERMHGVDPRAESGNVGELVGDV